MTQFETTLFVNADDKEFVGYFGGEPYRFSAGEERQVVKFVATHLAKHLLDRILQEKYGVKNTMSDTELRRGLLAKVLPEEAAKANVKPLTPEEEQKALQEVLNKQAETIKELQGGVKHLEDRLSDKNDLEKEVEYLKKQLQKVISKKVKKSKTLLESPAPESPENKNNGLQSTNS